MQFIARDNVRMVVNKVKMCVVFFLLSFLTYKHEMTFQENVEKVNTALTMFSRNKCTDQFGNGKFIIITLK